MRACKLGLILLPFVALPTSCGDDAGAKLDFQPRPNDGGTSTSSVATGSAATSATTGTATTSSTTGAGGSGGNASTSDSTTGGMAGSVTTGGGSGGAGGSTGASGGAAGSSGGAAGSGGSGTAGTGGQTTSDGGPGGGDITKVVPTAGCGKATPPSGRSTIMTMGTKPQGCADSKCGAWSYEREYFLYLPGNYNNTKAVPLVFQGPGCGAPRGGEDVYSLNNNVDGTVIRVGLTPPPNAIGHATAMNQGCFDDKEGDDSVDWVFYENLWDRLAGQLCFDKNRVFASGNSSGAWLANELGCKYAGDPVHPIRGVMPNTGGLPDEPRFKPTCTTKPMAGMWSHEVGDTTNPFAGNQYAITRAMQVNGCPGGSYSGAMWDPFPIGGGNSDNTCRRMRGCPEIYPLVACPLPGTGHGSHENVTNPGFSTFIKLFSAGAFITQ